MWVFAYGSLLWDPGFTPVEIQPARLTGWRRSFCMESIHYRGTPEQPGLVLALDATAAAACDGLALRVAADQAEAVLAYLRARELVSSAYLERLLTVTLADGRLAEAVTYVIDPDHAQYCRHDLSAQAAIIARAVGERGPNRAYLDNTAARLRELGVEDRELDWLVAEVQSICGVSGQ